MLLQFLRVSDKKNLLLKFFFKITVVFWSFSSSAVSFSTSYVHLDISKNWNCKAFNVTYVCHSKNVQKGFEYLVVVTAKERSEQDTLKNYLQYLKQKKVPKEFKKSSSNSSPSKVIHVRQRSIHSHSWVDGFHKGSEYPKYFTRYLATTNTDKKIAVLVTYSVHEKMWEKHSSEVLKSIQSLRLLATEETLRKIRSGDPALENVMVADYIAGLFGEGELDSENKHISPSFLERFKNHRFGMAMGMATGVVVAVNLLYFLMRFLRKKKRFRL